MKYKVGDIFYNRSKSSFLTVTEIVTHTHGDDTGSYYVEGYRTGKCKWLEDYHLDHFIDMGALVLTKDYMVPIKYIKTWTLEEA